MIALLLGGCALGFAGRGDLNAPPAQNSGKTLVFGRINYVIDGESKAPYGAFKPAWPAPVLMALRMESGEPYAGMAVGNEDGRFAWELPPGRYVVTRIGVGSYTDDTYIAWPRIAFRVPSDARAAYLGHLLLDGTRYTSEYTLSTGRTSRVDGVRYEFRVADEMEAQLSGVSPAVRSAAVKSLMFHHPGMPIGQTLVEQWQKSRETVIEQIFGR